MFCLIVYYANQLSFFVSMFHPRLVISSILFTKMEISWFPQLTVPSAPPYLLRIPFLLLGDLREPISIFAFRLCFYASSHGIPGPIDFSNAISVWVQVLTMFLRTRRIASLLGKFIIKRSGSWTTLSIDWLICCYFN